ncbi:MAG: hypothetical protein LBL21_02080 [Rickettsiales bacterium]|jgi:catalase (peroxidase I)|nr:hypothetical protein [Rickettsiales bacterium]
MKTANLIIPAAVLACATLRASAKVCVPDVAGAAIVERGVQWQATANTAGAGDFIISGLGVCSTSAGTPAVKGNPSMEGGIYCWCKMTSPRVGAWVFRVSLGSNAECNSQCAMYCDHLYFNAAFREAILAPL